MTTTSNMNTKFEFRTKFKKLLNAENCASIISAFDKFCSLDSVEALKVLWKMTYSRDIALDEVFKLGLDAQMLPSEKILVLRNELRYQYEKLVEESFLQFYKGDDAKISNAFATLKSSSDGIVASTVCDFCILSVQKYELERILYLLNSEKETYYFGGIRALGFDMIEADYLKPYHTEIHNLLKAMSDSIPFYSEEEEREREECKDVTTETPIESITQFKKITPEEILKSKESFKKIVESNYLNMLIDIAKLGFDLNEVVDKKEEIFRFINAAENLIN